MRQNYNDRSFLQLHIDIDIDDDIDIDYDIDIDDIDDIDIDAHLPVHRGAHNQVVDAIAVDVAGSHCHPKAFSHLKTN